MATSPVSQALTLKVDLDGDVRRLRGWPEIGSEPTFESLHAAISALFQLSLKSDESLGLKYVDDEGDLCILADVTLFDALILATQSGLLRVTATRKKDNSDEPSSHTDSWHDLEDYEQAFDCESLSEEAGLVNDLLEEACLADTHEQTAAFAARLDSQPTELEEALPTPPRFAVDGFERLKQQVTSDFMVAKDDMKEAFTTKAEQPSSVASVAGATVGTVVGVFVAARLVPLHLTRFAAHSVAVAAGSPTGEEAVAAASPTVDTRDAQDMPPEHVDDAIFGVTEEMQHFQQQVIQDFTNAHKEMEGAFKDLVGVGHNLCGSQGSSKCVLPAIAGALAGTLVAATLVPFRGARFAIAKTARLASGHLRNPAETEIAPQELGTDESTLPVGELDDFLNDAEDETVTDLAGTEGDDR